MSDGIDSTEKFLMYAAAHPQADFRDLLVKQTAGISGDFRHYRERQDAICREHQSSTAQVRTAVREIETRVIGHEGEIAALKRDSHPPLRLGPLAPLVAGACRHPRTALIVLMLFLSSPLGTAIVTCWRRNVPATTQAQVQAMARAVAEIIEANEQPAQPARTNALYRGGQP